MSPDALDLLRDANPVPTTPAWSEHEIRTAVATIVAGDTTPASTRRPAPRPARRWLVPALAAATVVAVAVGVAQVSDNDAPTPVGGSGPVTCQVSTDGGRARTSERLTLAKSVIEQRAKASGSPSQSFDLDPGAGTIVVRARGIDTDAAGAACRATTTALRPLVVAGVPVDAQAPTSDDPLAGLGFTVPRTETQAAALTVAQRARLAEALSHTACRSVPAGSAAGAVVRCETTDGRSVALLLGPALAADSDITRAEAVAPTPGGSAQWTIGLSFSPAASTRIAEHTTAHSSTGTGGSLVDCSAGSDPSCADFLAFEVDGRVLQVPLTNEPIVGVDLQVAGGFAAPAAKTLAAGYQAASIGLRLR